VNLTEFKKEFQTTYDMSSYGAPDLNNYEISLFLTKAVRQYIDEVYRQFEFTEYIKRGLGPLIKEEALTISDAEDYFDNMNVYECNLPGDLFYIAQENIKLNNKKGRYEIIPEDLDWINKSMKNPFRRPNKSKIYRTEIGSNKVRLYSSEKVTHYKLKYIKKYSPIVLVDFTKDVDLLGDETIEGISKPTLTELPNFIHPSLVDRAVVLAIKSFRENTLQTQIEV
jgi:hypothetical protein